MNCAKCGQKFAPFALFHDLPGTAQRLAKCMACGPWTHAEKVEVATRIVDQMKAERDARRLAGLPDPGCGCTGSALPPKHRF